MKSLVHLRIFALIFITIVSLPSCRSVDKSQSGTQLAAYEAVNAAYKIKNTMTAQNDFNDGKPTFTEEQVRRMYEVAKENNHTWPVETLIKLNAEGKLHGIYFGTDERCVSFVLLNSADVNGVGKFIRVRDLAYAFRDHYRAKAIRDAMKLQLNAVAKAQKANNFVLMMDNGYAFQVEFAQALGLADVKVGELTVPAKDEQTQVFQTGLHVYRRGELAAPALKLILEERKKSDESFEESDVQYRYDPKSLAVMFDAGLVIAQRQFSGRTSEIEFDAIGEKLKKWLLTYYNVRDQNYSLLLKGPAGVGKTFQMSLVVEAMARGMFGEDLPERFRNALILILDPDKFSAGTKYKGTEEERISALKQLGGDQKNPVVIFADEVQELVSLLAKVKAEMSNKGGLSVIGMTTEAEYKTFIFTVPAVDSRFAKEDFPLLNMSPAEALAYELGIVEKVFLKHVPLDADAKLQYAQDLYFAARQLEPGSTMRKLQMMALVVESESRNIQNIFTREGLEAYLRSEYKLPPSFRIASPTAISEARTNARAALKRGFEGQITDVTLQQVDEVVLNSFLGPGSQIYGVRAEKGSGRTFFAQTIANQTGRNHVSIKLSSSTKPEDLRREFEKKVLTKPENQTAIVSFEGFSEASSFIRDAVIVALQTQSIVIEGKEGVVEKSLAGIIGILEIQSEQLPEGQSEEQRDYPVMDLSPRPGNTTERALIGALTTELENPQRRSIYGALPASVPPPAVIVAEFIKSKNEAYFKGRPMDAIRKELIQFAGANYYFPASAATPCEQVNATLPSGP